MIAEGDFPGKLYDSGQQTLFLMYPRSCMCTMRVQEARGEMRRTPLHLGAQMIESHRVVLEPAILHVSVKP